MDAARRRKTILERLGAASGPIPAAALGAELGVFRLGDICGICSAIFFYKGHLNFLIDIIGF